MKRKKQTNKQTNTQNKTTTKTQTDEDLYMYHVFTRMPGESFRRRFRSMLYLCYVLTPFMLILGRGGKRKKKEKKEKEKKKKRQGEGENERTNERIFY